MTAFAGDGLLGTRAGGNSGFDTNASSPVGVGSIVQLVVVLAVVLLLVRYVMPKAAGLVGKRLVTNATGALRVEETASFAGGNLYVVRARHKTLLLSVTTTGVNCLADLTEPAEPANEPQTFQEMLDEAPGAAPEGPQIRPFPPQPESIDPFEAALARLNQLDRMAKK
jgi:hypothetical protein